MDIKLFMRSLDQEFTDQITNWDNGWPYHVDTPHCDRWSYQKSEQNNLTSSAHKFHNLRLRPEEFGGLLYDIKTKAIFSLDKDAFKTVNHLMQGKNIKQIIELLGLSNDNLTEFIEKLKGYQLWPT